MLNVHLTLPRFTEEDSQPLLHFKTNQYDVEGDSDLSSHPSEKRRKRLSGLQRECVSLTFVGERKKLETLLILLIANKSGTVCWGGDATCDESSKGMMLGCVCVCDFSLFLNHEVKRTFTMLRTSSPFYKEES